MTEAFSSKRKSYLSILQRGQLLLAAIGALCAIAISFFLSEFIGEMRSLNSASSDNVHWVLSQAEVEFLDFRNAIDIARQGDAPAGALDHVILEFDVFFSRMETLGSASLYADLRQIDGYGPQVDAIRHKLGAMVPLIDASSDDLHAGLDTLAREAMEIRPLLREIATTGLQFFAEQSDQSRESIALTLMRLALITGVLLLALAILLAHTHRVSLQTERRGRELADAYTRLNTILETSLDAIFVSDLDGTVLNFNSAAERIFGYKVDEVIGKNIADIIIPEHARTAHHSRKSRVQESDNLKAIGLGRYRIDAKRRNGDVFPVEVALEKATTDDDEMVVAFLRDISHRVAAETELVEARDRALAGEKAKADFLAMMTHEIRTPLNGLLGNLALLDQTPVSSGQKRFLRNMKISGDLLMHHVDAVLDVARFENGAATSREEVVHLGDLIQDIVDSQSTAAAANGNTIQWQWIGEPADWVQLDPSRMQQVLLNLVGNAIKFTQNGTIQIEAEPMATTDGDTLEIRVIDSGVGISEADQGRIFNDFQTVDDATRNGQSGTGLGLGIARRFVEAMGGEIGAESEPGEGSVFWLRVPLSRVSAPEQHPDTAPDSDPVPASVPDSVPAPLTDRHVLLVEDNEINLELARAMLKGLGHRVTEARNGEEAVTAASQPFDLILMDIRMPKMDG